MCSFKKTRDAIMTILAERQRNCIIDTVTLTMPIGFKKSRFSNYLPDNHHFSVGKKVWNHLTSLQVSKETFEMFHSGHHGASVFQKFVISHFIVLSFVDQNVTPCQPQEVGDKWEKRVRNKSILDSQS